jgi:hypothetical protein
LGALRVIGAPQNVGLSVAGRLSPQFSLFRCDPGHKSRDDIHAVESVWSGKGGLAWCTLDFWLG